MLTSSPVQFLVAVSVGTNPAGGDRWQRIGMVTLDKRCKADADLKKFFPVNTRSYDDILKACRWVAGESGCKSVDLDVTRHKVRVHRI